MKVLRTTIVGLCFLISYVDWSVGDSELTNNEDKSKTTDNNGILVRPPRASAVTEDPDHVILPDDCITVVTSERTRRDVSPCPARTAISPCVCNPKYNTLTCRDIPNDERLLTIFLSRFPQPRIMKLEIRHSALTTLSANAFRRIRIREFEIQNNPINAIESNAFAGSEQTALYVNLNHNEIETFSFDSIIGLRELRQLQLAHNRISEIPDGAFGNLTKLDFLALNANRIRHIGNKAFEGLPALTFLDLSNNSIATLGQFSLHFNPSLAGHLNVILNSNSIASVSADALSGTMPSFLSLMQNRLESLHQKPFEELLTKMAAATNMAGLAVKGNPLKCDCDVLWLVKQPLLRSNVRYYKCEDGQMLDDKTPEQFTCST